MRSDIQKVICETPRQYYPDFRAKFAGRKQNLKGKWWWVYDIQTRSETYPYEMKGKKTVKQLANTKLIKFLGFRPEKTRRKK